VRIITLPIAICRCESLVVNAKEAVFGANVLAQTVEAFKKFEMSDALFAVGAIVGRDAKVGESSGEIWRTLDVFFGIWRGVGNVGRWRRGVL